MSQPWKPHAYQRRAVRFLIEHGGAGLFLDPGLGKTSIAYAAFQTLRAAKLARRMLVVAPLRPAYLVWPAEASKWSQFDGLRVVVLHDDDKDERWLQPDAADIYVINPEGLAWLERHRGLIAKGFFDILCVDESSRFKAPNTLRFKLLRSMLNYFTRRWILTGSPSPNGLLDLFSQLYLVDQGRSLGRFITHYRYQYFMPTGYGGYTWVPVEGAAEKIYKRIAPVVLRMSKEEYLTLPPLTVTDVPVGLPKKAREAYHKLEQDLFLRLDRGEVRAANSAVATMKCRQVANGGLYLDQEGEAWRREAVDLHDEKTQAVVSLVDELGGQPAMVTYEFHHDLARLQRGLKKTLGFVPPHVGGGVGTTETKRIEAAWNNGELPVLLVQPQSAAHGLNLQSGGSVLIWHSLTYSYEDYDQLIQRLHRQGQAQHVFVYRVVAKETVDEFVIAALRAKRRSQNALFAALQAYRKRRTAKAGS